MKSNNREMPTMLFDGDCNFCRHWIFKWQKNIGNKILFAPYQDALKYFPQVTQKQCKKAVQLILPDGQVYSGAHAVFKMFAVAGKYTWVLWLYENIPLIAWISEMTYRWISEYR